MINLIATAALSTFFISLFGVSWDKVDAKISAEFADVKIITTQQLRDGLHNSQTQATLVDVREPEEFEVSRIENAINLSTAEQIAAAMPD